VVLDIFLLFSSSLQNLEGEENNRALVKNIFNGAGFWVKFSAPRNFPQDIRKLSERA